MFEKLRQRQKPVHPSFMGSVAELASFKTLIAKTSCPACTQQTLQLNKFLRGPQGWDAELTCTNCNFAGVVNNLGFEFKGVSSKGKARE